MNVLIVLSVVVVFVAVISFGAYTDVLYNTYYLLYREAYERRDVNSADKDYVDVICTLIRKAENRFEKKDSCAA